MLNRVATLAVNTARCNAQNILRSYASDAATKMEKWDLYAGVLVERLPVVSQEFNALEKEFQQYLTNVEFEKSLKSNHELQHERDLKQAELLKKGETEIDLDETASKQTAQDLKDAYTEEFNKFKFASRKTDDDKSGNLTSSNRCLDETLYLLTEQKLGNKSHLLLPQGRRLDGETMRQAAERVLSAYGSALNVQFHGNAPCGFYKYKYPTSARDQSVGAKVFFFRASVKSGNVDKKSCSKFEWVQKEALNIKLSSSSYAESVQKFLM